MKTSIIVRNNFPAFHRWLDSPEEVKFLRDFHRHIFYVETWFNVGHNDRDLEFFTVKREIDNWLMINYKDNYFDKSCETIAQKILEEFNPTGAYKVRVWEDNENGGEVEI